MHVILLVTTFVPVGENIQDTLHRQASGHTGRMNGIAQACLQKGLLQPISPVSPPCQVQSTLPTHPHPSRRSLSTVAFLLSCQSAISADAKALARQESIHRMPIVSAAVFSTPQALFLWGSFGESDGKCENATNARHAVGAAEREAAPRGLSWSMSVVLASSRDRRRYPP
jgi:hypothetical protein